MNNSLIVLKQLDQQLLTLKNKANPSIPKPGWARTIRKALGITIKQLAQKLQVDPSRVVKIESSEIKGAITLKTLQTVAESLDCVLVYNFIPKQALEEKVRAQAKKIATEQVRRISHTMDLESQSVKKKWLEEQIHELENELLNHSWKHLWEK